MLLTKTQINVIKSARKHQDYRVDGHGNSLKTLAEKGYVIYLGFNQNLGSVFGLTQKGIDEYNKINPSL